MIPPLPLSYRLSPPSSIFDSNSLSLVSPNSTLHTMTTHTREIASLACRHSFWRPISRRFYGICHYFQLWCRETKSPNRILIIFFRRAGSISLVSRGSAGSNERRDYHTIFGALFLDNFMKFAINFNEGAEKRNHPSRILFAVPVR